MKKLSLALGSMGLLSILPAAYADISVPSLPGGFEATVAGLYLNASDNNLNYFTQSLIQDVLVAPKFDINAANPRSINLGYQWGFLAGVGYIFPNTGNDLQVSWTHLDYGSANGPTVFQNPGYTTSYYGGDAVVTSSVADSGQAQLRDDNVDMDFGQYINVGSRLSMHAFTGLRYASFDQELNTQSNYFGHWEQNGSNIPSYNFTSNAISSLNSHFEGIGPLLGLDNNYLLDDGFGIQANADVALLVGSERNSGNLAIVQTGTLDLAPAIATQNIPSFSQTRIVPALDGKLGLDYSRNIHGVDFTLAGGYQVSEYFNVLDRVNADSASLFAANNDIMPDDDDSFTPLAVSTHAGNVGIDGPYLSLTVKA